MDSVTFTTSDVAEISGVSTRQLQHLTTLGILPHTGSGNHRAWTYEQTRTVLAAALLNGEGPTSTFPSTVRRLFALGELPATGWLALLDDEVVALPTEQDLLALLGSTAMTLLPIRCVDSRLRPYAPISA